ncbi:hypothetical protein CCM_08106 [Cordyceps militaris CM01]|uniref:Biotrophy-associated secreted 2 n=1 Tax=Cordyceps militaris (strain CM01) TaxID=983644 RepID=G3JNL3_CORMM|nr:uncharacterized protein CCM_08106 [Cordyceps militaris CM01]EGX89853.1 hypothetical protein CCM_08106 [Cordyceps militaris CM01]
MVRLSIAALLTFALTVFAVGDPAGAANVGNGQGKQFITGGCTSDADCASGCCAGLDGGAVCSARAVANAAGKQGCGFNAAGAGAGAAIGNNNNNNQNNGANNGNDGSQNCARSFTA